ncbi:hypothetical protein PanWU01x14_266150 [Parasponia andersonii]|uniref:Uncharacterized protein n=1 Tax=Parasponia andersonii TaxID=3476 RepID=A0A2P5B6U6_PARAD|nr:hypothetical protein PanWU01x14_266150 [Parasponia andersonii]
MGTCFCCTLIQDVKPRTLDPSDIYQQVEIIQKTHRGFTAASVALDGFPPQFLSRKYWQLYMQTPRSYQLDEAPGLNSCLRARLPSLDSLLSNSSSVSVVVGKWYCPSVFIKELDGKPKEQTEKSVFYEMTLEQRWDRIFQCNNVGTDMKVEEAFVKEKEAIRDWGHTDNGVTWYKSSSRGDQEEDQAERLLGVSILLTERIRWELERIGCHVDESERRVNG